MLSTKIVIQEFSLSFISFILNPEMTNITKNQLKIFLNGNEFSQYNLINEDIGLSTLYKIIPNTNFSPENILNLKIISETITSNTVEIFFSIVLNDGCAIVPFKITEAKEGKYIFTIDKVSSTNVTINSYPLMVINPLDYDLSQIWTDSSSYSYGELFNVYFKLITIEGTPVPDGFYEIQIIY